MSQNNQYATIRFNTYQHSYGSFGLGVDPLSTVVGIEVRVDANPRITTEDNCQVHVRLWKSSKAGTDKWTSAKIIALPAGADSDTYHSVGGPADLWGEAGWLPSDFEATPFLADLQFVDNGARCNSTSTTGGIAVDHIQVRVHYATPEPGELPDLTVSKEAIRSGVSVSSITDDQDFRWRWTISNTGEADAVFESGQVVLRDELPAGLAYSSPSSPAAMACSVLDGVLTCTASGTLTIPPDGTVQVSVAADPSVAGTYTNQASNCQVDYVAGNAGGNVAESDETNNACESDVSVQVVKRLHPRVCLRLVDDGDVLAGETATVFLEFENVTTGLSAGSSTKSYSEAPSADPITAGECSDLSYFPVGTVIKVTASVTSPSDATIDAGYPVARLIPGVDPTPPSPEVEFTVGDGDCGGPTNGEAVLANGTCNLHLYVRLTPDEPPIELPTISKVAATPAVVDGKARWEITIDQPEQNWAAQTITISDAHADIQLVGAPPCTVNAAEIVCSVSEDDLTVTVARPVTAETLASGTLCAGGTISNHLVAANAGGDPLTITTGATAVAINVRDTATCAPPIATKTLVVGGAAGVTDPEGVRWLLTLANPADGLDGVSVTVRDTDAILKPGTGATLPSGNLESWCDVEPVGAFEATCVLPVGSSVSFVVEPAEPPLPKCQSQPFPNVAGYRIGEQGAWTEVPGPTITLAGADSECPQDITIVKRLVNVPPDAVIDPSSDLPSITVPDGTFVSGPAPRGVGEYAWVYTVPPHYSGLVTESVPAGWEAVPCESGAEGAYTTFCNQPLANIVVTKRYVPNGGPDATDDDLPLSIGLSGHGAFVPAGSTQGNRTDYLPKLVSPGRYTVTETLDPAWRPAGAVVVGAGCAEVVPGDLFEALESELIRAVELLQAESSITFDAAPGASCTATFTNERLVATVVVEKLYVGSEGDVPAVAIEVDSSPLDGGWVESGSPTDRWQRLVPVASAGSSIAVTESLPAGWANAGAFLGSCEGASAGSPAVGTTATVSTTGVQPGETVTICFVNVAVGTVQLLKLDTAQTGESQTWNFISDAPGVSSTLTTADDPNTAQAQRTIQLIPAGQYTISELQGRSDCALGAISSDFQTEAAARVGAPPADQDVQPVGAGSLTFSVEKGQTTYIRFDNRGCGTVLGTGLIVVWKFSDHDGDGVRDSAEPPVAGWHFTIEGPDGNFAVSTDSEGKHVFTVAKGGAYTITEELPEGWHGIGSVQGGILTPGTVAVVQAGLGQHREVSFFNQPRVNIEVSKTEFSNAVPTGEPGDGWVFTLTGCGIEAREGTTGPDGVLLYADLPPAVGCSYTVTESPVEGWAAVALSRSASPDEPGETVTLGFRNIRLETCEACAPSGSQPGTTPVPTPPPASTATPTGTLPANPSPTATPTPEPSITAVAGERTPGPAVTPLPPDTGHGGVDGSSASLLLWLAGSAAIATGLLFLRASRRRDG